MFHHVDSVQGRYHSGQKGHESRRNGLVGSGFGGLSDFFSEGWAVADALTQQPAAPTSFLAVFATVSVSGPCAGRSLVQPMGVGRSPEQVVTDRLLVVVVVVVVAIIVFAPQFRVVHFRESLGRQHHVEVLRHEIVGRKVHFPGGKDLHLAGGVCLGGRDGRFPFVVHVGGGFLVDGNLGGDDRLLGGVVEQRVRSSLQDILLANQIRELFLSLGDERIDLPDSFHALEFFFDLFGRPLRNLGCFHSGFVLVLVLVLVLAAVLAGANILVEACVLPWRTKAKEGSFSPPLFLFGFRLFHALPRLVDGRDLFLDVVHGFRVHGRGVVIVVIVIVVRVGVRGGIVARVSRQRRRGRLAADDSVQAGDSCRQLAQDSDPAGKPERGEPGGEADREEVVDRNPPSGRYVRGTSRFGIIIWHGSRNVAAAVAVAVGVCRGCDAVVGLRWQSRFDLRCRVRSHELLGPIGPGLFQGCRFRGFVVRVFLVVVFVSLFSRSAFSFVSVSD
mmetsp:Transcript_23956/g.66372  ORF Transcript_23956/g.66372 Transcript_23956/m.66372 type:complete len:502 (-) Transcript_23956:190-1695(-)